MVELLKFGSTVLKLHILDQVVTEGCGKKNVAFICRKGNVEFDQQAADLQGMNDIRKKVGNIVPGDGGLAVDIVMQASCKRESNGCVDHAVPCGIVLDKLIVRTVQPEFVLIIMKNITSDVIQGTMQFFIECAVIFHGSGLEILVQDEVSRQKGNA